MLYFMPEESQHLRSLQSEGMICLDRPAETSMILERDVLSSACQICHEGLRPCLHWCIL